MQRQRISRGWHRAYSVLSRRERALSIASGNECRALKGEWEWGRRWRWRRKWDRCCKRDILAAFRGGDRLMQSMQPQGWGIVTVLRPWPTSKLSLPVVAKALLDLLLRAAGARSDEGIPRQDKFADRQRTERQTGEKQRVFECCVRALASRQDGPHWVAGSPNPKPQNHKLTS